MTHCTNPVDFAHPAATTAGPQSDSAAAKPCLAERVFRAGTAILILFMSPALAPATETVELRLASDVWPPFTNTSGQSRLASDLVDEALDRAGIKATTSIVEFGAVILGLQEARFDGCAAMWRTAARESFLLFSEPYLENRLVLVGRTGSDVTAARLADLAGKRVAMVGAYAYGDTVSDATEPLFIKGQNDQENLQKLLAGEVDYILVDELLIRYVLQNQKSDAARYLQIGSTPLIRRTLHFAVKKDLSGSDAIVEKFNAEIKKMLADGTYNQILRLSWIRADVDGDGRMELVPMNAHAGEIPPNAGYNVLPLDPDSQQSEETDRIWIDGRTYESWDSVPDRQKAPENVVPDVSRPSSTLFKFEF